MTIRQFIDTDRDANPSEVLTDQDILDTVKITDPNSESDSDDKPPKFHIPTISEAQSSIDTVIRFLEHEKQTTDLEINMSLCIQIFLFQLAQNSRKQKTINDLSIKVKGVCSLINKIELKKLKNLLLSF